jgi:CHASE3 domain sensor protein
MNGDRATSTPTKEADMSDQTVAAIARDLAQAMMDRARTRLPDDQKRVLDLMTQLCREYNDEKEQTNAATVRD